MDENDVETLRVLAWRVQTLEHVEQAMRVELHDLKIQFDTTLRRDYLTVEQISNKFVARAELSDQRAARRQWPIIIGGGVIAACNVIELIIVLAKAHG